MGRVESGGEKGDKARRARPREHALGLSTLVEEGEAVHVFVLRLLSGCLLLLLLSGRGSGTASGGGATSGGGGGRADVADKVHDVLALKRLGEKAGPEGLELDVGGLEDGGDLLALWAGGGIKWLDTEGSRDRNTLPFPLDGDRRDIIR